MRVKRRKTMALLAAVSIVCAQSTVSDVFAAGAEEVAAQENNAVSIEYLTLQPGERDDSVNLNWYAPEGTQNAIVRMGDKTVEASVRALHTPTKVVEGKYTDTGKIVCQATVSGLSKGTEYSYQISYDNGNTWSKKYSYETPNAGEFRFGFTSDPQIKENGETNNGGWNPSDGKNQTGWAVMLDKMKEEDVNLIVSAGDQVEDQSWGKSSEYAAFFAPEEMTSLLYAPAVGNHDRHYMFDDHFNLPNEMSVDGNAASLNQVKTTFRGQNSGTSQSHGNYIQATADEIAQSAESNGVTPNKDGQYDFVERREMETKGNYYYLYNNVLFVTLNTGAYPGGNDNENAGNVNVPSASKDNSEAEAIVSNFRTTLNAATAEYSGQYQWLVVTHHKSTQTVAKHAADSDIENYVDAGFEQVMDEFDVDFVLGGHDHVYSRSYVLKNGQRNAERLDDFHDPDGVIYLTGNCCSDMQYYTPFEKVDKTNNADYPVLANGQTGSEAYLAGNLPIGNQEWNQEYSPSYAVFDVADNKISVNVYNLSGDSNAPESKLIDSFSVTKNANGGELKNGLENKKSSIAMTQTAQYNSGMQNPDGGVMEIIDYNTVTGWAYAVNGVTGNLTAIPMKNKNAVDKIALLDGKNINIKEIVENNYKGFSYGDMTSVAVSPNGEKLAVAIQSSDYSVAGCLAVFLCGADGTLSFDQIYEAGVQPDMVTFTPDSKKILSADEGEPRNGYEAESIDPKGTVTVIDLTNQNVSHLDFTVFDSEAKRAELVQNGVILKKGTAPSVDLEPEYIAANDKTAYVTLQEANAIAIVDLQTLSIENICSAGYEDYEKYPIDIDKKDAAYRPVSYPSLRGIRMPDGISLFESNGKTYIVTANEGDSREWNEYLNEAECNFGKGQTSPSGKITAENSGLTGKVVFFDQNDYEGLNSEYDYLFGGRSFTVYCVDGSGMKEVYTSGNELEAKTAAYFPQYFNCSNDSAEIDDRSGKKGVEAESVTIGTVGEKTYAFIGLERIGGVMAYDITNPDKILFANYINSRDFSKDIAGDVSPEGLCMISASESADGNAYLLASCEVSGTVAAYKLISQNIDSSDDDNTDNNHDNNIDHNGSGHGGADTEDLNNQESKTNALKTGDHAPVIGTGIGMVLALSAIIVILKYRRSKNTITNTK